MHVVAWKMIMRLQIQNIIENTPLSINIALAFPLSIHLLRQGSYLSPASRGRSIIIIKLSTPAIQLPLCAPDARKTYSSEHGLILAFRVATREIHPSRLS